MTINYDKAFTYRAASAAFTPGALPEDVFTISGNATTNVYVLQMGLSTTQTTAGTNPWFIKKRSTANTGGVAVTETAVPVQSGNPAATTTVQHYTTTPTGVGTIVGSIWNGWLDSAKIDTAGVTGLEGVVVNFESMLGQPIALLSTAEVLSWSFNAGTLPSGLSVLAWVLWAEQSKT
jgi:hypothetical protein